MKVTIGFLNDTLGTIALLPPNSLTFTGEVDKLKNLITNLKEPDQTAADVLNSLKTKLRHYWWTHYE